MQKWTAAGEAEEPNGNAGRELQCLATSPFRLPDDWFVELKPRGSNPGHVDKVLVSLVPLTCFIFILKAIGV